MSTILIADDEARIRRLVSDFLKRDGHTIVEAADGKEALNILENRRPGLDMAILDVMMPGMDGFEVLRELREQEHGETHLLQYSSYVSIIYFHIILFHAAHLQSH